MRENLLQLLECPFCDAGAPALFAAERASGGREGDDEILAGLLRCDGCSRWYPIRSGILSVMPDALRPAGEAELLRAWRGSIPADVLDSAEERSQGLTGSDGKADESGGDAARQLEIDVRDREATLYDSLFPDEKFQAELDTYSELYQPQAGSCVLDLGCGTGRVTRHLLPGDFTLIGADFSWDSLEFLQRRLEPDQREQVQLIQCDACQVPIASGSLDAVVSCGLLCNIPTESLREALLTTLDRVLRPGGELLLSTYNWGRLKRLRSAFGLAETGRKEGYKASDGVYYYNHTADEMRRWLAPGFEVDEIRGTDNRIPVLHRVSARFNAWLDGRISRTPLSLPILARELAVKARRRGPDRDES